MRTLPQLFLELHACGRLIRAAGDDVRVTLAGLDDYDRAHLRAAMETALDRFGMTRVRVVEQPLSFASAVEKVVAMRLRLEAAHWGPELRVANAANVETILDQVEAADPMRSMRSYSVCGRFGLPMRVYESGAVDAPPWVLVLPHGVPAELSCSLIQQFAGRYRVIVVEGPELTCEPEAFERVQFESHQSPIDLVALIDHLAVPRVHLVGMCASAMAVLQFAAQHGRRVASLTIGNGAFATAVTPKTQYERDFQGFIRQIAGQREKARVAHRFVSAQSLAHAEPETAHLTMLPYASPDRLYLYLICMRQMYSNELDAGELDQWLGAIDCPALLLSSECDAVTHPAASRTIADALRRGEFIMDRGGTHLSLLSAPSADVIRSMRSFQMRVDA